MNVINKKTVRVKSKGSKSMPTVIILRQICEIKGWNIVKCCNELNIPKKQNKLTTKQISGYHSRAVEYLRDLRKSL